MHGRSEQMQCIHDEFKRAPVGGMRRGFTLVELLVVIAIISMLAGLLLPALEEAFEQARAITCQNNQRQMYLGMQMLLDDRDGQLPTITEWHLPENLAGYLETSSDEKGGPFFCPADTRSEEIADASPYFWMGPFWTTSYGAMQELMGFRVNQIQHHEFKVLFLEQVPTSTVPVHRSFWYHSFARRDMRHMDGHNVCHFNGSVRRYANPYDSIAPGTTWCSGATVGDWRYAMGKPTATMLKAYSFFGPNEESDSTYAWSRW